MTLALQFFERLSCMYRAQIMDPWWRWYSEQPGPRRALALFAGQYAYERQGRAPGYPHAAYFAIVDSPALDADEIWQGFQRELDGAKPNPKLNPLFHTPGRCMCARCAFAGSDGGLVNIVEAVRVELAEGRLLRASERLNRVRGVGPKIAPFFLRDIALWFKIEPVRDRELLQPVDVWVRRYVTRLTGRTAPSTDYHTARWICDNSAAPEAANQGLWYFGSRIAASEVKLRRALADDHYADELVERYADHLQDAVAAWRNPGHQQPDQL